MALPDQPKPVYLDNNATTKPDPLVVERMSEALRDGWANPSSVHRAGQRARQQLELARESLAGLLGCRRPEIVFTSGGTEAAAMAIEGTIRQERRGRTLVTSRLEHSAVRELAEAYASLDTQHVAWIDSDTSGVVSMDQLQETLDREGTRVGLVSVMWVNNETGVIQPIETIGHMCRQRGILFHTDATQWVGKMPTDVASLPVDLLSLSAHKFHGPKGVGALYIRSGLKLEPLLRGGPQEVDRRGGTENVAGIIGFGVAADLAMKWLASVDTPPASSRDAFESAIVDAVPGAVIHARDAPRIWNTTNIGFPDVEAETLLLGLSERGVYASAGAACSSGALDPSPVLQAMGVTQELARGSIRLSLARTTTADELDRAVGVIKRVVEMQLA